MAEKLLILVVGTNRRNLELMKQFLEREGYECREAATLREFEEPLQSQNPIALALVDISGFSKQVWDSCERLRDRNIPLLVISPRESLSIQQESAERGARGVVVKPLVVRELLALIRTLIR